MKEQNPNLFKAAACGLFLTVLAMTSHVSAALYLSSRDGSWADPTVWDPHGVPGDGDEAVVFHHVKVDTRVVVGANVPASTAVTLFTRSTLTITTDGVLTLHGDLAQWNQSFSYGEGAGRVVFDATRTKPNTTTFVWQIGNAFMGAGPFPQFVVRGTPTARFRVESLRGGGNGRFTNGGNNGGGGIDAAYTDFVRIGDATKLAIAAGVPFVNSPLLTLRNCRFFKSGELSPASAAGNRTYISQPKTGFEVSDCQFVRPLSPTAMTFLVSGQPHFDGWIATDNDFGGPVELNSVVTLTGNRYRAAWKLDNVKQTETAPLYPALTYLFSGPTALTKGVASTYTVALEANNSASALVISPSDGGKGGTFSPTSVTLDTAHPTQTFTYTPSTLGAVMLEISNNQGLLDDDSISAMVTEPATTFTLTAPAVATALVGSPSDPLVVALLPNTVVTADVVVTLNDGGRGGSFSPGIVVLSKTNLSTSVTYTAVGEGTVTIGASNTGGLRNPPAVSLDVSSSRITSYVLYGPDRGDVTARSGAFTVRLNDGVISGPVRITPTASNSDGVFDPAVIELTNSQREATFGYTPKLFGARTVVVSNDRGLSNPSGVTYLSMIQLGTSPVTKQEDRQHKVPNFGGLDPLAADSAWFNEFKRDVSDLPADPHSDQMLARIRNNQYGFNPALSGSWTPDAWGWYTEPYNVASGNVPLLSIPGTWSYNPASNGPYLLPPPPVVLQGSVVKDYPSNNWTDGGDHHLHIYRRNETTGGFKELWEYYQPIVTKDTDGTITAVKGASWRSFDLENGENPAPDTMTSDAAGMMFMPLVPRYEEVATGVVNHAFRWEANNTDISPTHKWPARTNAGAWNLLTGMPYGTRIRISQSWWDANADTVLGINTHARILGEAFRRYGLILSDGTFGTQIEMPFASDNRWDADLLTRLRKIPTTAFEVVKTPPLLQIDGPQNLAAGEPGTWRMTVMPKESTVGTGVGLNLYAWNVEKKGNGALLKYLWTTIPSTARTVTASYTFPTAGTYRIMPTKAWNTGFGPFLVTVGDTPVPASAYWIYIDGAGTVNTPATITVMTDHKFTGTLVLTPTGCGLSAPMNVVFDNESSKTITLTPTSGGLLSVAGSNTANLTDPEAATYQALAPATAYTMKGPATAINGRTSEVFTITPNGYFNGTIRPNDNGAGGVFTPAALTWSGTTISAKSFTYKPANTGTVIINTTNDASLATPSPLTLTVLGDVATALSLTGPATARVGQISDPFVVAPNGPFGGTVTPSDNGAGGTFSPIKLTWSYSSSPQSFTYTPATPGLKTISVTNNQGLANPNPIATTVVSLSAPEPSGSKPQTPARVVKHGQSARFSCRDEIIRIYNRHGFVKELHGTADSAGGYTFVWDMTNDTNAEIVSGVYRVNSATCENQAIVYVR